AALYGLLRCLVQLRFREEITAGAFQNLLAAVTPLGATFYAGHGGFSFLRFCLRGWRQEAIIDGCQPLHSLSSSLISRRASRSFSSAGAMQRIDAAQKCL